MRTKHYVQIGVLGALAVVLTFLVISTQFDRSSGLNPMSWVSSGDGEAEIDEEALARSSALGGPRVDGKPQPGDEVVGGVERPRNDTASQELDESPEGADPVMVAIGQTAGVDPETNDQTRSVAEALTHGLGERLSPVLAPGEADLAKLDPTGPGFDEAYREAYLATVEPGRVFQTAQPGPGVPVLSAGTGQDSLVRVPQDERVELRVQIPGAASGDPVTFTSFDLGRFDNELTSMTVLTDEQGVATVGFRGLSGTIDDVNILAGSPLATGQVRFTVRVLLPDGRELSEIAEQDSIDN